MTTSQQTVNPTTHLTRQRVGWTLIHQGMPLCADGSTLADCLAIAARMKLHVPARVWLATEGRFGSMAEAKAQQIPIAPVADALVAQFDCGKGAK